MLSLSYRAYATLQIPLRSANTVSGMRLDVYRKLLHIFSRKPVLLDAILVAQKLWEARNI